MKIKFEIKQSKKTPLQVVHLERLQVVEVLEVPLDDVGDGVGGDVQVAEVGELGPGGGEAEAQVGDLVVRDVEALVGGRREKVNKQLKKSKQTAD